MGPVKSSQIPPRSPPVSTPTLQCHTWFQPILTISLKTERWGPWPNSPHRGVTCFCPAEGGSASEHLFMYDVVQSSFLGTLLPSPGLGLRFGLRLGWVRVGSKRGVGGYVPRNLDWSIVLFPVGGPIDVAKVDEPTAEQVDALHSTYVQQVTQLFDEKREKYGVPEEAKLIINWREPSDSSCPKADSLRSDLFSLFLKTWTESLNSDAAGGGGSASYKATRRLKTRKAGSCCVRLLAVIIS